MHVSLDKIPTLAILWSQKRKQIICHLLSEGLVFKGCEFIKFGIIHFLSFKILNNSVKSKALWEG